MKTNLIPLITTRLIIVLSVTTISVMTAFIVIRYYRIQHNIIENLNHEAEVVSQQIADAIRPSLWVLYKKSNEKKFSREVTTAIVDAELQYKNVTVIRVFTNFGHLFIARVRTHNNTVDFNSEKHQRLLDNAVLTKRVPVKMESVTIGHVEITLTDKLYKNTQIINLQIEILQVLVTGGLLLVLVFIVLRKALSGPLLKLQIAKQALQTMNEGVIVLDNNDKVMDVNNCFLKMFCLTHQEVYSPSFEPTSIVVDGVRTRDKIRNYLRLTPHWKGELTLIRSKNQNFPGIANISAIRDSHKKIAAFVIVLRDMTDQKIKELKLEHMAYHDPLTKLSNRAAFERRLKHDIAVCQRLNQPLCLFFIDLDDFKTINDAFGHEAGDKLLVEISGRFKKRLRSTDTLARIGGDEFTIIMPDLQGNCDFEKVGNELISLAASPITIGESNVYVGASAGGALFPTDGNTVGDLLKHADAAMYRAKEQGRNRLSFYSREFESDSQAKIALETELRDAIQQGDFQLHYQAKVLIETGKPTGYEALLRWKRKDGTEVPPSDFIPIAEERGLIIQLGRWVIHNALAQMKKWHEKFNPNLTLAINISPVQFHDTGLVNYLTNEIKRIGISAHTIEVEITESTIIKDINYSIDLLKQLREIGVNISVDDFGTGYSSLRYLQLLPIDTLKIDKIFVSNIETENKNKAIAKTVISLADNLDLDIVVEGVEMKSQADILSELGCKVGQGFFFAKPVPPETIEHELNRFFSPLGKP